VQTLMSLEPLRARLTDSGFARTTLERWFDRIVRDGMALSLAGDYVAFPTLATNTLRTLATDDLDAAVDHVVASFAELPAQPDAGPAMRLLAEAGVRIVCLSNGPAQSTEDFLRRCELDRHVEQVLSVEDVERWKPAREVYLHAARRIGLQPAEVALVAVHAWDCHGAARAGLTTGWASRLEGRQPEHFERPDITGADLVAVAQGLLALPAGSSA
ncbi:MAG: HAD-IA family hydrolase, partial [Thermocrispum sp.]